MIKKWLFQLFQMSFCITVMANTKYEKWQLSNHKGVGGSKVEPQIELLF